MRMSYTCCQPRAGMTGNTKVVHGKSIRNEEQTLAMVVSFYPWDVISAMHTAGTVNLSIHHIICITFVFQT